jgi:hypothetical protein
MTAPRGPGPPLDESDQPITHNRQTSMPPVGFEPIISVGERPQTYTSGCAANGTGPQDTSISLNMAQAVHSSLDAQMVHPHHLQVRRVRHYVLNSLQQNSARPELFPSPNSNTFLSNTNLWFVQQSTSGHKVSIHFYEIATIILFFRIV